MFVTRLILTTLFLLNLYAWLSFVAEQDERKEFGDGAFEMLPEDWTPPVPAPAATDDDARRRLAPFADVDPPSYSVHHDGVCSTGSEFDSTLCSASRFLDDDISDFIMNRDDEKLKGIALTEQNDQTYHDNQQTRFEFGEVTINPAEEMVKFAIVGRSFPGTKTQASIARQNYDGRKLGVIDATVQFGTNGAAPGTDAVDASTVETSSMYSYEQTGGGIQVAQYYVAPTPNGDVPGYARKTYAYPNVNYRGDSDLKRKYAVAMGQDRELFTDFHIIADGQVSCSGKLKATVSIDLDDPTKGPRHFVGSSYQPTSADFYAENVVDFPQGADTTEYQTAYWTDAEDIEVNWKSDGNYVPLKPMKFDAVLVNDNNIGYEKQAVVLDSSTTSAWTVDAATNVATATIDFQLPRFAADECVAYKGQHIMTDDAIVSFYGEGTCDLECTQTAPCFCQGSDEMNDVRHIFDIVASTGNTVTTVVSLIFDLFSIAGSTPLFMFTWVALPSTGYLFFSTYEYEDRNYASWWEDSAASNMGLQAVLAVTILYVVFYTFILVLRSNSDYRDKAVDIVRGIFGDRGAEAFRGVVDDKGMAVQQPTRSVELSRSNGGRGKAKTFKAAAVSGAANL
tara:strand:+ start:733 stop:2598 length:1866 start_codon:yes stop_codon:yes gene_type:complete